MGSVSQRKSSVRDEAPAERRASRTAPDHRQPRYVPTPPEFGRSIFPRTGDRQDSTYVLEHRPMYVRPSCI